MIKLSATLIKDILSCSKKGWYRINKPDLAAPSRKMALGSVVHSVLETHWRNENAAFKQAGNLSVGYDEEFLFEVEEYTSKFFSTFKDLCTETDLIEYSFNGVSLGSGVELVGKIDRCNTESGIVLDWKTSSKTPPSIDTDIQFILYEYAYTSMFGKKPNFVALANLGSGKLVKLEYNELAQAELFDRIIPKVVGIIKTGNYTRDGMYGVGYLNKKPVESSVCSFCSFKSHCLYGLEK
jgi:CRISPR/Cas system-associated exonuclease Cas4 (RecB family)